MTPVELRALLAKAPKNFHETFSVYGAGDYYIETDEAGRDLYDAAVNALPALLDVAEAAARAMSSMTHHATTPTGLSCVLDCRPCALVAALAKLETP